MIQPPMPPDEEARLAELLSYNVLDTESEKLFDDITLLASQICNTPIALISLVDPDRQWFKSKIGLDVDETHRSISFCGHVVAQHEMMEVSDTLNDKRFHDNPLVQGDPNIRFYAGTPLITPQGYTLGTLCTIDREPKKLTDEQKSALKTLAESVMAHLELRKRNTNLEQINGLKTSYLSKLSHEFRTPLNAICTFSKLLEQEAKARNLPSLFKDALGHISTSGNKLLDAVDSMLGLGELTSFPIKKTLDTVQSRPFFHHIFHIMEQQTMDTHITLLTNIDKEMPEELTFDEANFCQALLKVLRNVASQKVQEITVDIMIYCNAGELIVLVKDTGPGMTNAQLKSLYETNYNDTFRTSSLLELRRLVDEMNGYLKVKSQVGHGTLVMFSVPVMYTLQGSKKLAPLGAIIERPSILVVEDNEINQEVMKSVFEQYLLDAEFVEDGETALDKLANNKYDLVFMDINLPGISGIDATRKVRETNPSLPIVAVTAEFMTDKSAYLEAGLDAVLTKPLDIAEIGKVLNLYLISGGTID